MLVDEGDPLTDIGLNKSISKIKSRNIFKSVNTEIKEGSKNDLRVIDIRVEEQPTEKLVQEQEWEPMEDLLQSIFLRIIG